MSPEKKRAYLMFIGAMLIFGTIGIFRRAIPLSSGLLACARGAIGAVSLMLFMAARRRPILRGLEKRQVLLLALSGALIGVNWILLFEAYNYTTVAVATLCYYMQPTIVILLSPLLFRERLTRLRLGCAAVSLAGMVLVSGLVGGGAAGASDPRGILFGLGSAAFYASVVILNKRLPAGDAYQKTIVQLLSAAVVLLPYLLLTGQADPGALSATSLALLGVVGVVHTGVAYALYFGGMRELDAQSVAVLSYIDPVSALILSALVLGEGLTPFGLVGAVLIIGAAFVSETKKEKGT